MNGYANSDLLPISALQHIDFCARQCALIHIERLWSENRLTVEGQLLHERVHGEGNETRAGIKIARGLHLRSSRLGLSGIADAVEFITKNEQVKIYPVEYKRGKPKITDCDKVQLCAQALCLEEMLGQKICEGALYYGEPRRREEVVFSKELREKTIQMAEKLHSLIDGKITPSAVFDKKCRNCSLANLCMPDVVGKQKSAIRYVEDMIDTMKGC